MKIRTRLTLRYTSVTALIFLLFAVIIYIATEKNREREFYHDLKKEAITKANLFFQNKVDAQTMHSIYLNNRASIDEVEVVIYNTSFSLLYHDSEDIDLVKETPTMINNIIKQEEIHFYQGKYQVIGFLYSYKGMHYVITAAAYDGYGMAKLAYIETLLLILCILGIVVLFSTGYFLAKGALRPFLHIIKEVEQVSATNLDSRISVKSEKDEVGELSLTFNKMLTRLENSFESQKMFVSNVSHELRTPLAALMSDLEITLFKDRSIDVYKKTLENVLMDSRKLVKLSDGLLDLAKANYDAQQIKMKEIRLDEVLLDARELVVHANEAYSVNLLFEQEADDDSSITVFGNEYLLRTAFVNLIDNNCKFSQNKTSTVRISFFESKSIIRFADTGIGVSQIDLDNIFTPFYRGANKGYAQGNGIGMALVHRIVMLHGGTINVDSQLGEGTVFTLEFPHV